MSFKLKNPLNIKSDSAFFDYCIKLSENREAGNVKHAWNVQNCIEEAEKRGMVNMVRRLFSSNVQSTQVLVEYP
jgi:hypothetical protein